MTLESAVATKLDYDLSRLLQSNLERDEEVPVIVRVLEDDDLAEVSGRLEELQARVRHVLGRFQAISVWVQLGNVDQVASWQDVVSIELAQKDTMAEC